jgi:hypothetical protein
MLRPIGTILAASVLMAAGCGGSKVADNPDHPAQPQPIKVQSPDLRVTFAGILRAGDEGTLVKDEGWREYVLEIENLSPEDLTVKNVRLLNPNGRYIESASMYDQVLVPPNTTLAVAGDVAKTTAGIVAGQIIPYGGSLVGLLSSATSTAMSGTKGSAQRTFTVRVLKGVDLAAGGKVAGSAFLPDVPGAKALVIDYVRGHDDGRVEIPLPQAGQQTPTPQPQTDQQATTPAPQAAQQPPAPEAQQAANP